jgi:hypothetical protein
MEAEHFDRLAALVGDAGTRRRVLRGGTGGALSAVLERLWPSAPDAQAMSSSNSGGGN